ncbi:DNA-directed primase polymerase isoform X1 isoform B [Chlorella sorokiniana]|uniref:DNA-directed primase/polymerase protein n=1 Tax=Chlorella sorokiniana TaxID=3076 RepID=A0A2P6TL27_CHLSO|nr:DNA-directed primase polymerase isoform X1 isoform B [Chlorella sorokiniana]|eukprot:PRW44998.1 DNA-directed primase polymerase isoform X1 isoform B [Chlorella sorokiniana]
MAAAAGAVAAAAAAVEAAVATCPAEHPPLPAFDRADSLGLDVFSVEYGLEGKRRFIVASRAHFWQRYSGMVQRHYYEIIRAGAPCHLYFDLEFGREDNPGVDGAAAVYALLSLLRDALRDRFSLDMQASVDYSEVTGAMLCLLRDTLCHRFSLDMQASVDYSEVTGAMLCLLCDTLCHRFSLDMQDDWVLELDSSTPTKFSRHLIVRILGAAFASNAHVGTLVLQLCAAARERRDQDERCARLIVRKGEEEALFVDPAVYSRNRAFRLYLSSKSGKQTILRNTGRFGGAGLTQRETFFATLITDVPAGARLLRCFEGETSDEAAVAAGRRALSSRAGSLSSGGGGSSIGSAPRAGSGLRAGMPGAIGASVSYGPCPYPELEQFVCSVCCEGGVQGRVRSWVQLEDVMLFSMRDNRWCGNVGRQHKSNGIYIVVDLREGSWHQKCYDPECRHYRSPLTPLPPELRGLWQPPDEPAAGWAAGAGDTAGPAAAEQHCMAQQQVAAQPAVQ